MKKSIPIILIIALLAVVLTACGPKDTSNNNNNDNNNTPADVYSKLNDMTNEDYSIIKLQVETTNYGVTLTNKYTATTANGRTTIRYNIQKLNEITTDENGNYVVTNDIISTEEGSAIVTNGKITSLDGKEENIPVNALENLNIKFDKSYFENIEEGEGTLSAKVKDITGFTGNSKFSGKDMSIIVTYGERLQSLIINYNMAGGASVKVTYTFQ